MPGKPGNRTHIRSFALSHFGAHASRARARPYPSSEAGALLSRTLVPRAALHLRLLLYILRQIICNIDSSYCTSL
ncbi:hypothetical protein BV20DRAFT_964542 [Pilatotrama ljubarskyi]|nr:hypothetical protein BV20DRAFT_964542 [Pilatotrama ljubarskyi]